MSAEDDYDKAYADYKEAMDKTEEQAFQMSDRIGKMLVTIPGGALILSVTFLGNIVKYMDITCLRVLAAGWLFLTASLGSMLWAHIRSQKGLEWEMDWYHDRLKDPLGENPPHKNPHWKCVKCLRNAALITCIIGLMLLSAFAYLSARATATNNHDRQEPAKTETNSPAQAPATSSREQADTFLEE